MAKEKSAKYIANVNESDEAVNEAFANLLAQLPNGGKLYKYRALKTFHEDELEEQYLWFSSAANLNDSKDCSFNVNLLEEKERLIKFFEKRENYKRIAINMIYNELHVANDWLTKEMIAKLFSGKSIDTNESFRREIKVFSLNCGLNLQQKKRLLNKIILYTADEQRKENVRNMLDELPQKIEKIRKSMLVCSLTTSYQKDSMWAYYCNNKGICIEYDFSRIKSIDLKKIFQKTQKVSYGRKPKFSFINILKAELFGEKDEKNQAENVIFRQLLTKDKSWSTEEEWRTILAGNNYLIGVKAFINFISAVYIDYSVLRLKKTRKILKLANENGWQVYVRYFDTFVAEYKYDTIEKARKALKRMKMTTNRG